MASLLDLAEARLRGLLDVQRQPRPSMVGLLGGKEPQGTLASTISGYTPPQMQAMSNQQVMDYARNVASSAKQNLQNQMSDLDKALVMDQGGINVGDRQALARLMEQIPGLMGAVAYHGTPHTIRGKFDISKVGTGEGAQAYGHGMYFAENPEVAKSYANLGTKNIAYRGHTEDVLNKLQKSGIDRETADLVSTFAYEGGYKGGTSKDLSNFLKSFADTPEEIKLYKDLSRKPEVVEAINSYVSPKQANLYKVDIPDEYIPNMLDWDKPLSEQPKVVQNAFKSILNKEVSPQGLDIGGAKILDNRNRQTDPTQSKPWVMQSGDKYFGLDQKDVDQLISNETAKGLYGRLAADLGSQQAASEFLLNQGVKGIRYLDQASRGKSGTSNFVVFDPTDVKILEKNKKKVGLLD